MIGREKALRLVKRVIQGSRADQTEALLLTEDSSLARFAGSAVHQHVAEKNGTLILRVVVEKKIAVVTTNDFRRSSLKDLLHKAISLAKVQLPKEDFVSLPGPRSVPDVRTFSNNIRHLTPEYKVTLIRDLGLLAHERGFQTSGAFSNGQVELAIVNSLGVEVYQPYSDLFLHLVVDNGMNTGYASFVSRDAESLEVERLVNEAMEKASKSEPVRIEPGEYETILEPYAVSELLSFLGTLGFHALAVQEGRSFLCNQFGKKIVDPRVTIFDDGLDPNGLQVPFDFEESQNKGSPFSMLGWPGR
jgi:predicted Zn-dependent protease